MSVNAIDLPSAPIERRGENEPSKNKRTRLNKGPKITQEIRAVGRGPLDKDTKV